MSSKIEMNTSISVCVYVLSHVWLFVAQQTVACQTPLCMEFSKQDHWSELPFLFQGTYLSQGIKHLFVSCIGRQDSLPPEPHGKP